ncbi:recombinase family protein [Sanguibacter sp. A246]|uniref:recombinase family protein n=1 Tax=Sanguibacter sp. A246 TaxID=3457326 RepID=UPI003FD8BA76
MAQTFGYARVSTLAQNLDAQVDALVRSAVGGRCAVVEHASGQRDCRVTRPW